MHMLTVATLDSPELFDCGVTPIPKNTDPKLTIIAATTFSAGTVLLRVTESVSQWCALYRGPIGEEVFLCLIGGGGLYEKSVIISKGERISIGSLEDQDIETGKLFIEFCRLIK